MPGDTRTVSPSTALSIAAWTVDASAGTRMVFCADAGEIRKLNVTSNAKTSFTKVPQVMTRDWGCSGWNVRPESKNGSAGQRWFNGGIVGRALGISDARVGAEHREADVYRDPAFVRDPGREHRRSGSHRTSSCPDVADGSQGLPHRLFCRILDICTDLDAEL